LWHGTEQFLLGDAPIKKEKKQRNQKLTRKQRRALRRAKKAANRNYWKPHATSLMHKKWVPRSVSIPIEVQQRTKYASHYKSEPKPQKKAAGVNIAKFMEMYGLSEEEARKLI
jgi:hypothetical protein